MARFALKLVLAAVAVLASCFLIYDALVFQSRSMQIRQLLVEAHPLERAPPETLRRLFLIEAGTRLDIRVARSLMLKLEVANRLYWWSTRNGPAATGSHNTKNSSSCIGTR